MARNSKSIDDPITVQEALDQRTARWKTRTLKAIAKRIRIHIQRGQFTKKFSPIWINPIFDDLEKAAKLIDRKKTRGAAKALDILAFIQLASVRLDTLEFEARTDELKKQQMKGERRTRGSTEKFG